MSKLSNIAFKLLHPINPDNKSSVKITLILKPAIFLEYTFFGVRSVKSPE